MVKVIHSIHFPVSARSFVLPIVNYLNQHGIDSELWIEDNPSHRELIQLLSAPKQFVGSDISLNPLVFLQKLFNYRSKLKSSKPDILHAHQSRSALIPLLSAYLEKVPIRIYQNHGLPYLGYCGIMRIILRTLEKINIYLATHVLFVSHSNLAEAHQDGLMPQHKGKVIANGSAIGIDLEEIELGYSDSFIIQSAKQKFSVSTSPFVLAYVGRPVKRKGFHFLIRAWEKSGLGLQGNILLIAGCTHEDCLKVMGYSVTGVRGLGYLKDLTEFYIACDAVVLPSKHEGFPYSLLEGAAYAKPLIGTDIPGIRCAIRNNQTGLLIPFEDQPALVSAINQLASDPSLRFKLGQNARRRVELEFQRRFILEKLHDFYITEIEIASKTGRIGYQS